MSMLEEVATYLANQGVANFASIIGSVGINIFLGQMPDGPDQCIALIEYPGAAPEYELNTYPAWENPKMQVTCRDTTYAAARDKALDVWSTLVGVTNQSLGGTRYLAITPIQSPFLLQRDALARVEFAFNCEVSKLVS